MINNYRLKSKHNNRDILLDIRFNSKTNNSDLILFVHGFKGFKDWGPFNQVADWFVEQGFAYAKLNLSHNGTTAEHPCDFVDLEAFGNNTFSIELDDLQVVIDFLFSENSQIPSNIWNNKKLHLIGHSRGGGLAVLKAAEESRVSSLITWAGINDLS
ncbi:MAG: dienelactone hydrolase, partial [Cyclobacteriaceae bacterium]|nr:dienelactone hydrolase [Cyclobacteriaceae bacterium]